MIKIGVFFGGFSREREVSFNGGRNVCQYIDRSIFEPIPIFVDSFGNFIRLHWQNFAHNSIRDFYPQPQNSPYRIYAESLGELSKPQQLALAEKIGTPISPQELSQHIDFALIAMHGNYGEDGNLQGLLEWYGIPYSGSGVFGSALGINKALQNGLIAKVSEQNKKYQVFDKQQFYQNPQQLFEQLVQDLGLPLVIKAPHQGSSIGVGILKEKNYEQFVALVEASFFQQKINATFWQALSPQEKVDFVQNFVELDKALGFPLLLDQQKIYHPQELLETLDKVLAQKTECLLLAQEGEEQLLVEEFIKGREFTCAVIQKEDGKAMALLPSEAQKAKDALFDFDSKYKGLVKEVIVMQESPEIIAQIRRQAEQIFEQLGFQVYMRMDGFVDENAQICFHDPNTIPGMSSASFIFKQFAELGFLPTHTISFLIRTSLQQRLQRGKNRFRIAQLLEKLDNSLAQKSYEKEVTIAFEDEQAYQKAKEEMKNWATKGTHKLIFVSQDKKIPVNLMFRDNLAEALAEWHSAPSPHSEQLFAQSTDLRLKYAIYDTLERLNAQKVEHI